MQQSAVRIMDLAQSWHPKHFATWCLLSDCHWEIDLLRTIVVRYVLCRQPCAKLESFISLCKRLEYSAVKCQHTVILLIQLTTLFLVDL